MLLSHNLTIQDLKSFLLFKQNLYSKLSHPDIKHVVSILNAYSRLAQRLLGLSFVLIKQLSEIDEFRVHNKCKKVWETLSKYDHLYNEYVDYNHANEQAETIQDYNRLIKEKIFQLYKTIYFYYLELEGYVILNKQIDSAPITEMINMSQELGEVACNYDAFLRKL